MRNRRLWLTWILTCLLVFMPAVSHAGLGVSIDIFSFGPFSIGIDIPISGALILGGIAVGVSAFISFFSPGSTVGSYSGPAAQATHVTISPGDTRSGNVLRAQYTELITDPRLPLPGGGYLEWREDGRLPFRGVDFHGYACFHYNNTMTVRTDSGELVLVVKAEGDKTLIVQENTERGAYVTGLLFGHRSEILP